MPVTLKEAEQAEPVAEAGGAPRTRFEAIAKMAEEGHPAEVSCRVLSVVIPLARRASERVEHILAL